jgi:hypothetical protein
MKYEFWIPTLISVLSLAWNYLQSRRIINLETKAENKRVVHRFQFEKEFAIYTELWGKVIELRIKASSLRPIMDFRPNGKTEEEIKQERLKELDTAYNELVTLFQHNKPFYSNEIYQETKEIIQIAHSEAIDYSLLEERKKDYWEKGKENIKAIDDHLDKLFLLIRQRIEFVEGQR